MKKTIPLGSRKAGALVLVLALGLAVEVANADFTFGTPTNLGLNINSPYDEWDPSISMDGLALYFNSWRPGGYGESDLWVSKPKSISNDWGEAINLGPIVNSTYREGGPSISVDGLELYFDSSRPGGLGSLDLWVARRATKDEDWAPPVNLGPVVNSSAEDQNPCISTDGLELFFESRRVGSTNYDLWVTSRESLSAAWGPPVNLGPIVNNLYITRAPSISSDGLRLFLMALRAEELGLWDFDIWMTTRASTSDPWAAPVNLGPTLNSASGENNPDISTDGLSLFFASDRPGGLGNHDIWQVPIIPIVDFNGDGIVDALDICIMADHWHTDYQLCDIGPMPWGDGTVDVQDLIVLAEHLFEGIPPVEPEKVNVDEEDAGSQVELEQGQILVVTLESNPTTGYRWEVAEIQESILEQMGEAEFKPSETGEPPLVGAGGWEIFRFKAISAGQMTLQLVYRRSWEEGVEPINTFSIEVVVN